MFCWAWWCVTAAAGVTYVAVGWWLASLPYHGCIQESHPAWAQTITSLWPLPLLAAAAGIVFAKGYRWWFLLLTVVTIVAFLVTIGHAIGTGPGGSECLG